MSDMQVRLQRLRRRPSRLTEPACVLGFVDLHSVVLSMSYEHDSRNLDPVRGWWTSLGFPSRSAESDRLAAMCVGILRDVCGVPSPADLEYRAERDAEDPPENETFHEEDLEPAEPHLVLDQLRIRDANLAPLDA